MARVLALASFVVLVIACGAGNATPAAPTPTDDVLHLAGYDISEIDLRELWTNSFADRSFRAFVCSDVYSLTTERFAQRIEQNEAIRVRNAERQGEALSFAPVETPVPGQKVDIRSAERMQSILKEVCGPPPR
jgi:hypothetical protein